MVRASKPRMTSSSSTKPFRRPSPTKNRSSDIELVGERDVTRVIDESLGLDPTALNTFRMVRFVRVRADEKSADAALAEVEVIAAGDNISLGVLARGGSFVNGLLAREPQNMFDGITDTYGNIFTVKTKGGWRESGVWWSVDLGCAVLARRGIHLLAESRRRPVELPVRGVASWHRLPNPLFRWAAHHWPATSTTRH